MKKTFFKGIGFGALTAALFTLMVFITISCCKDDPIIPDIPEMNIGDTYEGGIVAFIYVDGDPLYIPGEVHGIICSEDDMSAPGMSTFVWGTVGLLIEANDPINGQPNTDKIIAAEEVSGTTAWYAALVCDDYSITVSGITYDDWYLPSHSELSIMIENGVLTGQYWSSNEIIGFSTQAIVVPPAPNEHRYKDKKYTIRAVRKF